MKSSRSYSEIFGGRSANDQAYPQSRKQQEDFLISTRQGRILTPLDDVGALAGVVAGLAADRARLVDLIGRAAADGEPFTDVEVFRHRAELIKARLGPLSGKN